ncbi:hypothetical protein Tco_1389843, partial [Tanacetum coccineum]
LKDVTSVRRPSSRGSSFKNSVLSNIKNQSEDVEIHVRTNKKTNVTSKKNVVQTKKIVTNVAVKNALKAKDIFCISRDKNVLTSCHDKCLAKYNLSVNSKVRRAIFTTPRTLKSKSLDTTHVVAKTRFAVVTLLSAKNKDSGALRSTSQLAQEHSLSKYIRTKIKTSRKCQKWLKKQPNIGWSPKSITAKVIQIVPWIVDSGCSKHMTGILKLLKTFIEKFREQSTLEMITLQQSHDTAIMYMETSPSVMYILVKVLDTTSFL